MFCTFCGQTRSDNDGDYCRDCGKLDPVKRTPVATRSGDQETRPTATESIRSRARQTGRLESSALTPSPSSAPWTCASCGLVNMPESPTCECGDGVRPTADHGSPFNKTRSGDANSSRWSTKNLCLAGLGVLSGAASLYFISDFAEEGRQGFSIGYAIGATLVWVIVPFVWRRSKWAGVIALSLLVLSVIGNAKNAIEGDPDAQSHILNLVVGIRIVVPAALSGYLFRKLLIESAKPN